MSFWARQWNAATPRERAAFVLIAAAAVAALFVCSFA